MQPLPASAGWRWITRGIALLRKQPGELSMLFFAYMFVMLALNYLPHLGSILALMLTPVFSLSFLQACADIEQGKAVHPRLLLLGFRSPALLKLLQLGLLHLLAAGLAVLAASLLDQELFTRVLQPPSTADMTKLDPRLPQAMLLSALLYVPAAMAFWYAAPLIAWQKMGIFKAVFFSFFAVLRERKAFLCYAVACLTLGVVIPLLGAVLIAALVGNATLALIIFLSISVGFTLVFYCSFYPSYVDVFGPLDAEKLPPARDFV